MMDVTRGSHGEVVIRVEGRFDTDAAGRLAGWLREIPEQQPVVLEFGHECLDVGLAAVAGDLAARESLHVRGLTLHQEKILRYLGVEIARTPSRAIAAG
jgi:hypothetical protein